ncbi:hypothetical protein JW890_08320 [candidate division WOR-3 bacterium]|nr:hypothetical protein [candidate division WOR-3 bacterium]
MAIRIIPLACGICGAELKAKEDDAVFLCPKCLKAMEPRETDDLFFDLFSTEPEKASVFLPYYLLTGAATELSVEVVDLEDLSELGGINLSGYLNPFSDSQGTKEEIITSAGIKLAEAKKPKKTYRVVVAVPSFRSKNLIQYGMEYGKIFDAPPLFQRGYAEPTEPIQMSSQGAILTSKNLVQLKRARENSYILSIDFDWRVDNISVVVLAFTEKAGMLENAETGLKIPVSALKE